MTKPKQHRTSESGRKRSYKANKLLDATEIDNHDGRPSLLFEDPLLDLLKHHHFIDRKGKIRERPLEPPELPSDGQEPQKT